MSKSRRLTWLVVGFAACLSLAVAENVELTQRAAINPHWNPAACGECHGVEPLQPRSIPHDVVDLLCLTCHDGKRATREAHPIGRTFTGGEIRRPNSWPTPGNKLSCITCHDVIRGCKTEGRRPVRNPMFLRGFESGDLHSFCAACHVPTAHQRFNPHRSASSSSDRQSQDCLHCHSTAILNHDPRSRTFESELLTDEPTLCGRCHTSHSDYFSPGHLGASVAVEMRANLIHLDQRMGIPSQDMPMVMPVGPGHTIACSTCHNPHSEAVFPADSILAIGAIRTEPMEKRHAALRIDGKEFCSACHAD